MIARREGSSVLCLLQTRQAPAEPAVSPATGRPQPGWLYPLELHRFDRGVTQVRPFVPAFHLRELVSRGRVPAPLVAQWCASWAAALPEQPRSFRVGWHGEPRVSVGDLDDAFSWTQWAAPELRPGPGFDLAAAQVFELAAVAFLLLTGVDPFGPEHGGVEARRDAKLGDRPALDDVDPSLPREVLATLEASLRPEPEQRPALEKLLAALQTGAKPLSATEREHFLSTRLSLSRQHWRRAWATALAPAPSPPQLPDGPASLDEEPHPLEEVLFAAGSTHDQRRVAADAMLEANLRRGELTMVDLELEPLGLDADPARVSQLLARRAALLQRHPELTPGRAKEGQGFVFEWRFGFVWEARFEGQNLPLRSLLTHPSMRHLDALELSRSDLPGAVEVLVECLPRTVRVLKLGLGRGPGAALVELVRAHPQLQIVRIGFGDSAAPAWLADVRRTSAG